VTSSDGGPSGLVVIDKPSGPTSHDVVGRVRRLLHTRRVGHAGTLDPMATGVLVVGVNRATRLLGRLALHDKEYEATIRLGQATTTDDAQGTVLSAPGAAEVSPGRLADAMAALTGDIAQRPSAVSAIRVDGRRSYERVRAGENVELPARPVRVSRFDLLGRAEAEVDGLPVIDLDVRVECSTGTYVRALARDLGAALGTGGHLTRLRRTRVGSFRSADAQPLPEPDVAAGLAVIDLDRAARRCFGSLDLDAERADDVTHGRALRGLILPADPTALFGPDGRFLALYRQDGADARPEAVFVSA